MKNIEKIGRYSIAENRGALFLRWWNPILKKTEATRLKATNLEQARTAAKQLIRVIADPSEMIMPGSNGDPTFGEVWLPFEQEKRKSLGLERFRLLENRRDLYFRAYFWNVRMSKMDPALKVFVEALQEAKTLPQRFSGRGKDQAGNQERDGKSKPPRTLHPNTIYELAQTVVEVCDIARSDNHSTQPVPRIPFIAGRTAPEDRDPKGRYLTFPEIGALIDAARREHMRDMLMLALGSGARPGSVAEIRGSFIYADLGVIDLLGVGSIDNNKRRPIAPITGPMQSILTRLVDEHGDGHLIRAGGVPLALGARNWTQMVQRLVRRSGIDDGLKPGATPAN